MGPPHTPRCQNALTLTLPLPSPFRCPHPSRCADDDSELVDVERHFTAFMEGPSEGIPTVPPASIDTSSTALCDAASKGDVAGTEVN